VRAAALAQVLLLLLLQLQDLLSWSPRLLLKMLAAGGPSAPTSVAVVAAVASAAADAANALLRPCC
jgi:hypothetical protein